MDSDQPGGIAVFGEALIDLLPTGDTMWHARPGGSPANVVVATARLGQPTWFLGGLSTDRWGQVLAEHVRRSGASVELAPRNDAPTAMALVDLARDGSPSYRFLWEDTADRAVTSADLPDDLGPATWLQVGSVAAAFEDSGATVAELVDRERDHRLVACDPNVRMSVYGNSATVAGRLRHLIEHADLVKASDEDLSFLEGDDQPEVAARRLLDGGAGLVAVTRGARGALLVSPCGTVEIAPVRVEVVDTVGAGDTFMAALLAGLCDLGVASRDDLHALTRDHVGALGRFAAAAAAVTVSRPGADPPLRADLADDLLLAEPA